MNFKCEFCGESPTSKTCSSCQKNVPTWVKFCPLCGAKFKEEVKIANKDSSNFANRVLCSDGTCIGIIGSTGLCTECRKPEK